MAGDEGVEKYSEAVAQPSGIAAPVFISYASQDAETANAVCKYLESHGVSCWMAPRNVKPGSQYADAIVRAINDSKAVVLILSGSAIASSHVGREVERAASKRKPIVPFRLDTATLNAELEYFLSNSQWIELPKLGMPAALASLKEAVGQGSAGSAQGISVAQGDSRRPKQIILAAAIFVAVAAAVLLGVHYWSSDGGSKASVVAPSSDKSIAVLPFVDMSEKKDQEYFGDGMAEEIINLLTNVPKLKVIGRTSSFQFKRKTDDLRQIGKILGAAYLVEGSVRRSDNHVRVTAQLVNTSDGVQRWAQTYDREVSDVLKVQDDIALGLVRALQLEVAPAVFGASHPAPPTADAYDSYLRGKHARDRIDQRGLEEALADFRHTLQLEPSFSPAVEAVASTLYYMANATYLPAESGFNQARDAAEAALKLDLRSSDAHAVICIVNTVFDWDWSAAAHECAIAAKISPNKPFVLLAAAIQHMALGEFTNAAYSIQAAIANDPLDPVLHNTAGLIYVRAGRFTEAEAAVRRSLQISPTSAFNHLLLGIALLMQGKATEALTEMQQERGPGGRELGLAIAYYALHRELDADVALARLKAENGSDAAFFISEAYAFRGQKDQAFEWLGRAFAQKDNGLYSLKGAPLLKNLEGDPRYEAFLKKMNLPE
jgi:TolB-like protein